MCIIPGFWEAEAGRLQIGAQSGKLNDLIRFCFKIKKGGKDKKGVKIQFSANILYSIPSNSRKKKQIHIQKPEYTLKFLRFTVGYCCESLSMLNL